MQIQPQGLVAALIIVVIFLLASFARLRKGPRPPVRLNLHTGSSERPSLWTPALDRARTRGATLDDDPTAPGDAEKSLNAFFIFNGHAWDAYEALGLPAGSSLASARAAHARAITAARPEVAAFLGEAMATIERRG